MPSSLKGGDQPRLRTVIHHPSVARRMLQRSGCALLIVAASTGVVACGSSASSSGNASNSSGSSASNSHVSAAKAFVAAHSSPGIGIGISQPLPQRPPTGKRIIYVQCATAICTEIGDGLRQASQVLGWKLSTVTAGSTPSSIQAAWNSVVQENPDGVAASANPKVLFAKQLATLASRGVPYVVNSVTDHPGNGVTAVISGLGTYAERGRWLAQWATANANGAASTLFVGLSDFPVFVTEQDAFRQEYRSTCPGCAYASTDISLSDLGTAVVPSSIVSAARRIPNLRYIVTATGELTEGLLPQLRSAGLTSVKVISQAGLPANFEDIADGSSEVMDIPAASEMIGWMLADALARHFEGVALPQHAYDVLPGFFMTKQNVSDPNQIYAGPPGYQAAFQKLWHVS